MEKERLVLMPLRVGKENQNMAGPMETALAQGLQQQYRVYSGDEVAIKAKEIAKSRVSKKDCDETKCFEDIAMAFNSEYIASASVTQIEGGYLLSLNIRSIADNKAIYSKSTPCEGCTPFQVIDKLKELSGVPAQAATQANAVAVTPEPAAPAIIATDTEGIQWGEVQKGNSIEDYEAYLLQYPKGKYGILAKGKIKKLKEQEAAAQTQQDQSAWDSANSAATEASYQSYLNAYPQGSYANLATARIAKLKKESAAVEAKQQREAAAQQSALARAEAARPKASGPVMARIPGKSYELGKYEVSQKEWRDIMGSNPSKFTSCGDNCPVEQVSWNDIQEFIQKLNAKTGKQYRLPTEVEWEYACYGGSTTEYCGGNDINSVAWSDTGADSVSTHPVGQKQANGYGLYDMSGNVWEWMSDCNDGDCAKRVLRGGSWYVRPQLARALIRYWGGVAGRGSDSGFRLARTLP